MGPQVIIVAVIFGTIFGIAYLFFLTRNKERLAIIEKGVDASIFVKGKTHTAPIWKILFLNCALIMVGVGLGIFIAAILHYQLNVIEEVAYPGTIFTMAGIGLLIGFKITNSIEKE
jgi:hypothetical protein